MSVFAASILILLVFLLLGVPVAFSLALAALSLGLYHGLPLSFLGISVLESLSSVPLLSLPLFVLLGQVMLAGKISERLFDTINSWTCHLPGGLAVTIVFTCAMFAAIIGSGAITTATIGMVAYPAMLKRGYDKKFTLGLLASGGTLGILIPPSIPLILYSAITGCALDSLFVAGIVPGLLMTALMTCYAVRRSRRGGYIPAPRAFWAQRWYLIRRNIPSLLMPVLIIGAIYSGLLSPAEAAAAGVIYGLATAIFFYKTMTFSQVPGVCREALCITCMIGLIVIGAHMFGKALAMLGAPQELMQLVLEQKLTPLAFILAVSAALLVLGTVMETASIVLITTPLVFPSLLALNMDPVWYGVVLTVNMTIALISPPVGIDLYVVKGLRDDITLSEVIRGAAPFMLLMLVFLGIVIAIPPLSTWLPSVMLSR